MSEPQDPEHGRNEDCLNCGARLRGQYCGQCGQRARYRLISLWELISDAFGDLFELDSRLWRTLIPLLVRPGQLTADYLRGRRVRFMPPFRTYLVLSLLFFGFAFFDAEREFGLLFEAAPESADTPIETMEPDELFECNFDSGDLGDIPARLAERIATVCERVNADRGRTFVGLIVDNLPAGLYVLLPFAALYLKMLYPLSRRYYVEHLLFVVHFHAFVFLALILQLLMSQIGKLLPTAGSTILSLLIPAYIPVYLYKALRRVYGQRHLLTIPKYVILLSAYFVSFGIMLAIMSVIAVLSL